MIKGFEDQVERKVTVVAGNFYKDINIMYDGSFIRIRFGYNKSLLAAVKPMEGARWNPGGRRDECGEWNQEAKDSKYRGIKCWYVKNSPHNNFQLSYMMKDCTDPYTVYDTGLLPLVSGYPLREHQLEMMAHFATRPASIGACEMGTGKTLAWIAATEYLIGLGQLEPTEKDIWYVGPVAGVRAVGRELIKWNANFKCKMITYSKLVSHIRDWDGSSAPKMVCFDESSKIKNDTSQRSKAAMHLANAVREEHPHAGRIVLLSGTPAPKTPVDWWNQCQTAQPGFLVEGTKAKFKSRLCLIEQRESQAGGAYPHILSWLDDENKCAKCGQHRHQHDNDEHRWVASVNEVNYLYQRMSGLVLVKFKKDCMDLPEKLYDVIQIKPNINTVRAAKLIKKLAPRAVTALTKLRALSDGFQYTEECIGTEICPNCNGEGNFKTMIPKEEVDLLAPQTFTEDDFVEQMICCEYCGGSGEVNKYKRAMDVVESPKDNYFIDDLDALEDVGRYIVWGGFTGTIDRLTTMAHSQGWTTLQVDGRGYIGMDCHGESVDADELLSAMDASDPHYKELWEKHPKVCFVGHPKAGGMALTLTASPVMLFYSNCFDGEARMQAEDRFHRLGMDENRACTVKDLIHLPTDMLVLDNLKKKKRLQNLSMNQLDDAFADLATGDILDEKRIH